MVVELQPHRIGGDGLARLAGLAASPALGAGLPRSLMRSHLATPRQLLGQRRQQQRPIGQHPAAPARLEHGGARGLQHHGGPHQPLARLQLLPPPAGHLAPGQIAGRAWVGIRSRQAEGHPAAGLRWGSSTLGGPLLRTESPQSPPTGRQQHLQPLHHQRLALHRVAKALAVARFKGGAKVPGGVPVAPRHLQAPFPARGPQLQAHPCGGALARTITGPPQALARLRQQGIAPAPQLRQQLGFQGPLHRRAAQRLLARKADAVGREHPGQGMEQHLSHAESLGQGTGVLAAGTAVTHQHRGADVMAALNRDAPDRVGHPLQGDATGTLGERLRGERGERAIRPARKLSGQRHEAVPHDGGIGGLIASGPEHRRQRPLRKTPQQQVGVGDGERTTTPIGGRTRICPRRLRTHLQPAALQPHHRPPAGCNGVDRQGGGLQAQTGDGGFGVELNTGARLQMEHIRGRSAHVEAEDRPLRQPRGSGHRHGAPQAPGRPREHRVLGQQLVGGLQHPSGGHHPQTGGRTQGPPHLGEVGLQHRPHGRLHQGGVQTGQQPRQAAHPVGEQHRGEAQLLEPGPHRQLVGWIGHGVEQGHGAAVQPFGPGLPQLVRQRGIAVEGFHLRTIGGMAAGNLQHPVGQQRRPFHLQGKDVGAVLIAKGGDIGKAPVHQQQHRSHAALQQGIGGHGGAEPHLLHQACWEGLPHRQAEHLANGGDGGISHRKILAGGHLISAIGLPIPRRPAPLRQHLAHHQGAIRRPAHQVREGAAPVDPEPPAPAATLRARWRHGGRGRCWRRPTDHRVGTSAPPPARAASSAAITQAWI